MAYMYRFPSGKGVGSGWLKLEPYFTLPQPDFFPHGHQFSELTFIITGKGKHLCGGKTHITQPGDLIFCPPGLVHQFRYSAGQIHRNIHFDPNLLVSLKNETPEMKTLNEFFPASGAPSKTIRLLPKDLGMVEQLLHELDLEQKQARPGRLTSMRMYLKRILITVTRLSEQREVVRQDGRYPVSTELAQSYKIIQHNAADQHTLDSLASLAGMSKSHFRRLFKQMYGEAPINLLIRERIRLSAGILERSDKSITDVALQCGFNDGNYFSRQFKNIMGTSPNRYRRTFKAETR
jgi:AraC family transcriptional regulator, L-rhamnose operon transcriptional activator RhaR